MSWGGGGDKEWNPHNALISRKYGKQTLVIPTNHEAQNRCSPPHCEKQQGFKARTFMSRALTASLLSPSLSLSLVPTTEDASVSSAMPKTTTITTTTAVSTVKGRGDTTVAGADPRDGRDPFEDSRGSSTAEPTIPELPPTPRRFCEATRRRAIDWPQTHTGTTVERPCPKGTRGISTTFLETWKLNILSTVCLLEVDVLFLFL